MQFLKAIHLLLLRRTFMVNALNSQVWLHLAVIFITKDIDTDVCSIQMSGTRTLNWVTRLTAQAAVSSRLNVPSTREYPDRNPHMHRAQNPTSHERNRFSHHWSGDVDYKQTPRPVSASELCQPSYRLLSAKLVPIIGDKGLSHSQPGEFPSAVISVSGPEPLLFLPSSSSVVLKRLSGPRSRPTTCQKMW
jgi:hypothetical protein